MRTVAVGGVGIREVCRVLLGHPATVHTGTPTSKFIRCAGRVGQESILCLPACAYEVPRNFSFVQDELAGLSDAGAMLKLMDNDLRSEMDELLEAWAAAIVANDADRIDAFAEEDWVLVGTGGVMTREGFLGLVASGQLTHEEMNFEILGLWDRGDLVVVLAHGTNRGHWRGQPFAEDEYVTEVFARHADGWRCVVSTLTSRKER